LRAAAAVGPAPPAPVDVDVERAGLDVTDPLDGEDARAGCECRRECDERAA
jgi:hypothetical protein